MSLKKEAAAVMTKLRALPAERAQYVIARFVGHLQGLSGSEHTRFSVGGILRGLGACIEQEQECARHVAQHFPGNSKRPGKE